MSISLLDFFGWSHFIGYWESCCSKHSVLRTYMVAHNICSSSLRRSNVIFKGTDSCLFFFSSFPLNSLSSSLPPSLPPSLLSFPFLFITFFVFSKTEVEKPVLGPLNQPINTFVTGISPAGHLLRMGRWAMFYGLCLCPTFRLWTLWWPVCMKRGLWDWSGQEGGGPVVLVK